MTYDHVGPICRSATDVALMFRAMTNHPILKEIDPEGLSSDVSRLRIGVLRTSSKVFCDVPANQEVQTAFDLAVEALRPLVAEIRDAELVTPDLGSLIEAEWYEYHSQYVTQTPELYDFRTNISVLNGNKIKSEEVTRWRKAVQDYRASVHRAFSDVDVMVIPTLPELPMALADADDPFEQSAYTFPFNIGGLPTISVPCGFSQSGLPIGMQLTGPPNSDARILALAQAYERVTDWHKRRPPQ